MSHISFSVVLLLLISNISIAQATLDKMSKGIGLKGGDFVAYKGQKQELFPANTSDSEESENLDKLKQEVKETALKEKREIAGASVPQMCWPPRLPPVLPANARSTTEVSENSDKQDSSILTKKPPRDQNRNISLWDFYYLYYSQYYWNSFYYNPYYYSYWNPYGYMEGYGYQPDPLSMLYNNPYWWYWNNNLSNYYNSQYFGGLQWGGQTYDWRWSNNWMFYNHGLYNNRWWGWRTWRGYFWNNGRYDYFWGWRYWNIYDRNWNYWGWLY
jgi:hypothetical protein